MRVFEGVVRRGGCLGGIRGAWWFVVGPESWDWEAKINVKAMHITYTGVEDEDDDEEPSRDDDDGDDKCDAGDDVDDCVYGGENDDDNDDE